MGLSDDRASDRSRTKAGATTASGTETAIEVSDNISVNGSTDTLDCSGLINTTAGGSQIIEGNAGKTFTTMIGSFVSQ